MVVCVCDASAGRWGGEGGFWGLLASQPSHTSELQVQQEIPSIHAPQMFWFWRCISVVEFLSNTCEYLHSHKHSCTHIYMPVLKPGIRDYQSPTNLSLFTYLLALCVEWGYFTKSCCSPFHRRHLQWSTAVKTFVATKSTDAALSTHSNQTSFQDKISLILAGCCGIHLLWEKQEVQESTASLGYIVRHK